MKISQSVLYNWKCFENIFIKVIFIKIKKKLKLFLLKYFNQLFNLILIPV